MLLDGGGRSGLSQRPDVAKMQIFVAWGCVEWVTRTLHEPSRSLQHIPGHGSGPNQPQPADLAILPLLGLICLSDGPRTVPRPRIW